MIKWRRNSGILILAAISVIIEFKNVEAIDPLLPSTDVASPNNRRVPKQVGAVGGKYFSLIYLKEKQIKMFVFYAGAIMNGKDQQQAAGYHHDHNHGFAGSNGMGGGGGGAGMGGGGGGAMGGGGMMHGDGKYFQ
jgi:uncharacterized membrane protein YgcG